MLLTIVAIEGLMSDKKEEDKFKHLLNDSLVIYQKLMVSEISGNELDQLKVHIKEYLTLFKKTIGPLQIMHSRIGLKLTKFHVYCILIILSKNLVHH